MLTLAFLAVAVPIFLYLNRRRRERAEERQAADRARYEEQLRKWEAAQARERITTRAHRRRYRR